MVDPMSLRIMRTQPRPLAIGIEPQPVQLTAGQRPIAVQYPGKRRGALAGHRFAQRRIIAPEIAPFERRRLVLDHVGLKRWRSHGDARVTVSARFCRNAGAAGLRGRFSRRQRQRLDEVRRQRQLAEQALLGSAQYPQHVAATAR